MADTLSTPSKSANHAFPSINNTVCLTVCVFVWLWEGSHIYKANRCYFFFFFYFFILNCKSHFKIYIFTHCCNFWLYSYGIDYYFEKENRKCTNMIILTVCSHKRGKQDLSFVDFFYYLVNRLISYTYNSDKYYF